ncbi:Flp pilus assembly protein CpaB [Paenibacillus montanisoli]|uniref:Flp pilus assembly protein CpaB n=1 Tax=Paenibacillus montanisoli TaxID=2081970 RepID=A0A328TT48_9BACL|nr:Flp pilus assembly protein CpaB [Paenibacillus montanisoli]RAP73727.1 Flp pilus assembly protein CpaB [Paenibacillus montanisoli]
MRSKLVLIAALLMGIVTTVLFFNYMKQYKEVPAAKESLVRVVAVKQDIKKNTKLTAGMLQIVQVPASAVHAKTLRNQADAEGKISASDLAAGEMLLANHLKDQEEEAQFVSKKVRDGYRAVSIGVNIVQSVSNLIEPGDYVDVVYTRVDETKLDATNKDKPKPYISTVLLENAHVLAIGRRMVEAAADTPYAEYAQVTLELKPEDGVKVINADENPDWTVSLMLNSRIVKDQTSTEKK